MRFFKVKKVDKKKKAETVQVIKTEEIEKWKVPKKVFFEIVTKKDDEIVIVSKGKIGKNNQFKHWKHRSYFANRFLQETFMKKKKEKVRYLIRWNMYYSEALGPKGLMPEYAPELENHLMNSYAIQMRDAVGKLTGNLLANLRPFLPLIILVFVMGIPIGTPLNDIFHLVPNTQFHWIQRP